jgi:hypothetical protein
LEEEFFALLDARDKTAEALEKLKKEGTEAQEAALVRALAFEASGAVAPDRFVQVKRLLDGLESQHKERIEALREFLRRFCELIRTTREKHRAEVDAAIVARIAKLEEQKKLPGAPVTAIEAEIARLKKELGDVKCLFNKPPKPKSPRPRKT